MIPGYEPFQLGKTKKEKEMKQWTWNEARKENVLSNDWLNFRRADLRRANLRWADLSEADLFRANLSEADLSGKLNHN